MADEEEEEEVEGGRGRGARGRRDEKQEDEEDEEDEEEAEEEKKERLTNTKSTSSCPQTKLEIPCSQNTIAIRGIGSVSVFGIGYQQFRGCNLTKSSQRTDSEATHTKQVAIQGRPIPYQYYR